MIASQPDESQLRSFFNALAEPSTSIAPVKLALENGVSPLVRNEEGWSALAVAAEFGCLEGAKLLIAAGANVNRRDVNTLHSYIRTPLHRAVVNCRLDMIDLLLANGADPRVTDECDRTAAHGFVRSDMLVNPANEEQLAHALMLFEQVLAFEGVATRQDNEGITPLHHALGQGITPEAFDLLLTHGSDLHLMSSKGKMPIHFQWWRDSSLWQLQKLIEHGADINARDRNGLSALCTAGDAKIVSALLELGADINHLDNLGRNPLAVLLDNWSRNSSSIDACKALIEAGINTTQLDLCGASVESRIEEHKELEVRSLWPMVLSRRARIAMVQAANSSIRSPSDDQPHKDSSNSPTRGMRS